MISASVQSHYTACNDKEYIPVTRIPNKNDLAEAMSKRLNDCYGRMKGEGFMRMSAMPSNIGWWGESEKMEEKFATGFESIREI